MEAIANFHNWYNGINKIKSSLQKEAHALRIGVLGAAAINYFSIIDPIQTHPGVILAGIAARDIAKAQAQIDKYKLGETCTAYGSYDELLSDEGIDAVYIPLPNGLHAEWAIRAMEKGKHVLIEKPIASNAEETLRIKETSERTGKVALEAFHWRFHPAPLAIKTLISKGTFGSVTDIQADVQIVMKKDTDIRFDYSLAGGSCMDLTYVFSACQFFSPPHSSTFTIETAQPRLLPTDPRIDEAMESTFTLNPVKCHIKTDLCQPPLWGIIPRLLPKMSLRIELEKASIELTNFVAPAFRHRVIITSKETGKKEIKTFYKGDERGEEWWTTYRYQLEAFVSAIKAKRDGKVYEGPWMGLDESVQLMQMIDAVYEKAGMPRRGV